MNEQVKLKKCPFCGNEIILTDDITKATCTKMSCFMMAHWLPVDKCNIRPLEDELQEELNIAKRAIRFIFIHDGLPDNVKLICRDTLAELEKIKE